MTRAAALLKLNNVESMEEWQAFVKERNSRSYKEKNERFKKMRASQTKLYTTRRKGFTCLEAEMRAESEDPDSITRDDVYIRGHTRKNGEPINESVGETLNKIKAYSETVFSPSKHSLEGDGGAKVFGPKRPGRVRGLGFGATPSKLNALVHNHNLQTKSKS
ncbi:uncharacterized protein LOC111382310 [Olea europaea var. sylvestris]|uniref:uncharacterized protein LOC111382310 n=1 Tax=Olea europaea var. sylvestris TaxID=158386 RepID=UPI000C1D26D7|nr:uncharacterized protein LOC111382310 [Olea europaea var. sylvestris]